jgi:hypothetical protein
MEICQDKFPCSPENVVDIAGRMTGSPNVTLFMSTLCSWVTRTAGRAIEKLDARELDANLELDEALMK